MKPSRSVSVLMALCFTLVQLVWIPQAHAALVSPSDLVAQSERVGQQSRIADLLQRERVAAMLQQQGVDAEQLVERLDRLTNAEIAMLDQKMDQLPTGEGALELVLVVFLVLILLDVLGVTNIFPGINSAR